MKHEGDEDTTCNCCAWIAKMTGRLGNMKTSGDHPGLHLSAALLRLARILRRVMET